MNDIELDEMLDQWGVPPADAELRERVRGGFVASPKRRYFRSVGWKGLFAGFAAAAVLFVVVTAEAFPSLLSTRSRALRVPYQARSVVKYAGSSRPDDTVYSFSYKGTEIALMQEEPRNLEEHFLVFHMSVHRLLLQLVPNLVMPESAAKDAWFSAYVRAGCVDKNDVVIGHEKVLGYETTVIQNVGSGWRWTGWRAPELGCFSLRTKNEDAVAGGGYKPYRQRDTVSVWYRPAGGWAWELP